MFIEEPDTSVKVNSTTITANDSTALYQWLDCDNNYSPIAGQTNQSFTATSNGSYALAITQNGCTDTSSCYTIANVGIDENNLTQTRVYPNPTNGKINIDMGFNYKYITATIRSSSGQIISSNSIKAKKLFELDIIGPAGMYLITIETDQGNKLNFIITKK